MENPIKMDDLGVPPFTETPIYTHTNSRFCSKWIERYGSMMWQLPDKLREVIHQVLYRDLKPENCLLDDETCRNMKNWMPGWPGNYKLFGDS